MGRAFIPNKILAVVSSLGHLSMNEKLFQIGPTVLILKLDKKRMMDAGGWQPPHERFSTYFLTMKITFNLNKFRYGVR